jgi:hypothetical protein
VLTRRFPRFEVDLPVTLTKFWDDVPTERAHGRCHILAEGGLGATVMHDFYMGEIVRVDVPRVVRLYATIKNNRGRQYGLEFVYLDDAQRRAIRRFCESQEPATDS